MGTFVKDNISGINVGSKSSNVSGKTVQSSNIDISNIERGSSEFTSNSNISSSVDFGDLFNDKAQASEVSSASMTNGSTNIDGTNQSSSSVSQHGMSNDKVNQDSTNQQTGNAQSASLSNGKNEENNTSQATGRASSQGATSGGNQGSSTGQQGGSAHGTSTSSGKGPSGSKGATGAKASGNSMSGGTPASGRGGSDGHKAGGVEVKSTSVKNATRPTAFNNNSSMQQTGTTVTQKTVKSSKVETNASKAEKNTGSIIGKAIKWFVKEVVNVIEVIKATEVVIATSVLSAVGNIVEAVVIDGLVGYVVAGALDFFGADDIANDLRKFAARDQVGEINKWFYEETDIGRQINELSAIKYDSAVAKGITSLSETVIKIAAATAISMVPGGIFIVAGIGALEGMGNAAESAYQNALANGETDLTLRVWDNIGILGSGALDAVAWVFNAKLGQGFLEIAGDIGKIGIKETAMNFGKQLFSKDTIKNILNPKNLLMNMGQSGLQSGGQIGKIFSKFMNGEEIKAEDWWDLAQTYGTYLFLNIAEDVLKDTISNYKSVDNIKQMEGDSSGSEEKSSNDEIPPKHDGYYKKRLKHYLDNGSTGEEARKLATRDTVALELRDYGYTEDEAMKIADIAVEGKGVKVETAIKVQQDLDDLNNGKIDIKEFAEYYIREDSDYQKTIGKLLTDDQINELKSLDVDLTLVSKYPEVYSNPKYSHVDPDTGKVVVDWPQAEGAKEYNDKGWTNEQLLQEGNKNGVEALKIAGARELTIDEILTEEGQLTRVAAKNSASDDGFGEYFGGGKVEGTDDIPHRVLGPYTSEYGKVYEYSINDEITIPDAEISANKMISDNKIGDVWTDGDGLDGTPYRGEVHIVPLETHADDWFDQEGGAKQISFYLTDSEGHILVKDSQYMRDNNIPPQLYKLTRDQLVALGIIDKTW